MIKNNPHRRKGFAVILTTLSLLLLVPMVGLAIDVSILYMIRAKLSAAVDAAVLAGAQGLARGSDTATQNANAQDAATRFFNANFPSGYWGTTNVNFPAPTIDDSVANYRTVSATASATAPLYFLRVFGADTSLVSVSSQAGRRDALVMLVLDRSSSMTNPFQGTTACAVMIQDSAQFLSNFAEGRDMVGLVIFGSSVYSYPPSTTFATPDANGRTVLSLINQIKCQGNTDTVGGLQAGYSQIQAVNSTSRVNVIVLLTDGRPNGFIGDYTKLRKNPGSCDTAGNPLIGVAAQWAGGPKPSGTTAGLMPYVATTPNGADGAAIAAAAGCQMAGDMTKMRNDLIKMPAVDVFGNSTTGPYSQYNTNSPYYGQTATLDLTIPAQVEISSVNAVDNEATTIRTDAKLKPAIYTIALEGNDPADPPDTLMLRKMANDPSMESDADPIAQMFFQQQKGQTTGYFADAPDPSQLAAAFNSVAAQIVVRLSR